ncbi:MAG TPA: helix-turn-helix domain-containing protein [Gammaproteobacteria bacterium]
MFHYKSCGLPNVWLKNGYDLRETPYGSSASIHDLEGLHRVIGLDLVNRAPALNGAEIRFLRKELDFSQAQLARFLGVGETSVRGWENERQRITPPAERMLRLLYREHVMGDGTVRELVERLSELDREVHRADKLELEETREGWRTAA